MPIYRIDSTSKLNEKIGVGFIVQVQGEAFLITARHVITDFARDLKYCVFEERSYNLERPVYHSLGPLYQPDQKFVSDYAVYKLQLNLEISVDRIELAENCRIDEKDEFELLAIGNQAIDGIVIACIRFDTNQDAMIQIRNNGDYYPFANAVKLGSIDAPVLGGYSGSPVFRKGTNQCIGFISSGTQVGRIETKFKTCVVIIKSSYVLTQPPFV